MSQTIKEFEKFHPRAVKLLRKRKPFLVVAEDEPYYLATYEAIRANELLKDTWTEEDEFEYCRAAELPLEPSTDIPAACYENHVDWAKLWDFCPGCGARVTPLP